MRDHRPLDDLPRLVSEALRGALEDLSPRQRANVAVGAGDGDAVVLAELGAEAFGLLPSHPPLPLLFRSPFSLHGSLSSSLVNMLILSHLLSLVYSISS